LLLPLIGISYLGHGVVQRGRAFGVAQLRVSDDHWRNA
jgi:hypothetical protein